MAAPWPNGFWCCSRSSMPASMPRGPSRSRRMALGRWWTGRATPVTRDALLVFPEAGTYCVVNAVAPAAGSVSQGASGRQLLGTVLVEAGTSVPNLRDYLTAELVAAAEQTMPAPVRAQVVAD